jgi:hypothetical protein
MNISHMWTHFLGWQDHVHLHPLSRAMLCSRLPLSPPMPPAIARYSLRPGMIVVVGARATSLNEFVKNMYNICISK